MEVVREYLDICFDPYRMTEELSVLKEELLANAEDRYNELIAEGKDENEASDLVIASLGDIDAMLKEMNAKKRTDGFDFLKMMDSFSEKVSRMDTVNVVYEGVQILEVWLNGSDMDVTGKDTGTVSVYVEDDPGHFTFEQNGNLLAIRQNRGGDDLSLDVPKDLHRLVIRGASGDLDIADVHSYTCELTTASGDIDLNDVTAETMEIMTGSGDVDLSADTALGNLHIRTASGDIDIHLTGELNEALLESASGDIVFEAEAPFRSVTVKAVSGDIECYTDEVDGVRAEAVSFSGEISNRRRHPEGDRLISAETVSGDITIY